MQAGARRLRWDLGGALLAGVASTWVAVRAHERSTRESQRFRQRWEGVSRASYDVVWELSPDWKLTFVNAAAERVFRVPPDELIGIDVVELVHPDDRGRAAAILRGCVRDRTGWSGVRIRVVRADGDSTWIETNGVAHVGNDGELVGFTATTHELPENDATRTANEITHDTVSSVLDRQAFSTVLQPIFSLFTGCPTGAEALTRFSDEPIRSPDRWFADAHEVGLGVELELAALRAALRYGAERLPADFYLSLNVSPATLVSDELLALLSVAPVPAHRIVLELTEHVSINDYGVLREPLSRLAGMGVRLAVDDAGAGFASFRHILRTRPAFIKIDQAITRHIDADAAQRALAAAVVVFALELGATVVAEGVETPEELDVLISLGIDAAQGFLLARPGVAPINWPNRHPAIHPASPVPGSPTR